MYQKSLILCDRGLQNTRFMQLRTRNNLNFYEPMTYPHLIRFSRKTTSKSDFKNYEMCGKFQMSIK